MKIDILKKAKSLASNISGKGKTDMILDKLTSAIGKPCVYCLSLLDLSNVSLDHIVPYGGRAERANPLIRKELDRDTNLQLICSKCNRAKGDISHEHFLKLNRFLDDYPILAHQLRSRLAQGSMIWTMRRRKN